ncbi:MAG: LamG-like jellyroll fold domain-containing protein, partial [Bacteroidota bacterium]
MGSYAHLYNTGQLVASNLNSGGSQGYTVEFLLKPSREFTGNHGVHLFNGKCTGPNCPTGIAGQWRFSIKASKSGSVPAISYSTFTNTGLENTVDIRLNGIDRKNICYYLDDNWHHFAIVYNADPAVRTMCLYVDGQTNPDFCKTIPSVPINNGTRLEVGYPNDFHAYRGYIDELAAWDQALPEELIYQHYENFLNGNHYDYTQSFGGPLPSMPALTGNLNPLEFPPGVTQPSVKASDQLKSFPGPRYQEGHTLARNFIWFSLDRLTNHWTGAMPQSH